MSFRILLTVCILLLTATACLRTAGRNPRETAPARETVPVRTKSGTLPDQDSFKQSFGYIRCGKESFPICSWKLAAGFSGYEPWGYWSDDQQSEMQIGVPWSMLGKEITLDFPAVGFALFGPQQQISAEFAVGGKTVLQKVFTRETPQKLSLRIPAGLNRSQPLKLSIRIHTKLRTIHELVPQNLDPRTLGFAFHFLREKFPLENYTRGTFEIAAVDLPDKNGNQAATLRRIDVFQGPLPPTEIKTVLWPVTLPPQDPVRRYCRGEQLELLLDARTPQVQLLFGRAVPTEKNDLLGIPSELTAAYPPCQPVNNPPLPDAVCRAQRQQIAGEIPFIRGAIKSIRKINALDERFQRAWIRRQKKLEVIPRIISPETGQEIERFQNRYCWKSFGESCFALPKDHSFAGKTGIEHNIVALHSLSELLRASNIQLIVMLIPDADQIAGRVLVPEFAHIGDLTALQCASTLLEYGLEAVYPDDAVLAKAYTSGRLFCYPDPTPEVGLWKILAGLTAQRLERFGTKAFREPNPAHYSERRGPTVFGNHYRWPEEVECGEHKNGETVESLEVFRNGTAFRPDPRSEILVIGGDTLSLPGPGHSFSGQLSLQLQYPVDELVLPGEVWFHNLPSVLCRNPERYLRGKKVCLLMISPRMLTGQVFPDIRKESKLYADLRGKKLVHRFEIKSEKPDFGLTPPIAGEQLYHQKEQWDRQWERFSLTDPPGASLRIADSSREQLWTNFALPEKFQSGKPSVLVLEAAVYPLQAVTVSVNGRKIPLRIDAGGPHFRFSAAELPPHTKNIEIKVSGRQDNRVIFRNVLLYQ